MKGQPIERSFFRKILDLYVYGSFHIALSALFFTWFFGQFGNGISPIYLLFIFFATWAEYSGHKAIGILKMEGFEDKGRFNIIRLYRSHIFLYLSLGGMGTCLMFFKLDFDVQWKVVVAGLLSLAYILPIFTRGKRLRDFGIIKIFIVAFVWSWVCCVIPVSSFDTRLWEIVLWGTSSLFFVLAITIPFDIRDIEVERFQLVNTIPLMLGVRRSLFLSIGLLLVSGVLAVAVSPNLFGLSFAMSCLISAVLVVAFGRRKNDLYFSLLLDGTLMLPALIYFLIQRSILL